MYSEKNIPNILHIVIFTIKKLSLLVYTTS